METVATDTTQRVYVLTMQEPDPALGFSGGDVTQTTGRWTTQTNAAATVRLECAEGAKLSRVMRMLLLLLAHCDGGGDGWPKAIGLLLDLADACGDARIAYDSQRHTQEEPPCTATQPAGAFPIT